MNPSALKEFIIVYKKHISLFFITLIIILVASFAFLYFQVYERLTNQTLIASDKESKIGNLSQQLTDTQKQFEELKNQDQVKLNQDLKAEIDSIQKTYGQAVETYEKLQDAKAQKINVDKLFDQYNLSLKKLSEKNYNDAGTLLADVNKKIDEEKAKLVQVGSKSIDPSTVTASNTAPGSGYSRQKVTTDIGEFVVDIVAADLSSTKVIIDTASDSDCAKDCPVLSLGDYVGRSGAFAGINGSYFCPADYPSCADKKNSFDTLLMNKNKHYFNSDNNVYSTVPAAIFSGGSVRFVTQSLQWGRDTGVDGVIANHPLMLLGGQILVSGGDAKQTSTGPRSFVAHGDGKVYIGVVRSASVGQAAKVLQTMGIKDALNLDSGGSTALWSGGYKAGPGRNIPNAVLFVRK